MGRPSTKVTVICTACNKETQKHPSTIEKSKTKVFFCGQECAKSYGCRPKTGEERVCPVCNYEFYARPSRVELGKDIHCSMKCAGISRQKRKTVTCEKCNKEFETHQAAPRKYCSQYCAGQIGSKTEHVCKNCNLKFEGYENRIFCGDACSRKYKADNSKPYVDSHGYVIILVNGKKITEHRYIMAQEIGRPLLKEENVHHKNGNRQDNRLENLEIWNTSQPSGQRIEDKVRYAIDILNLYAPNVW